MPAPSHRLARRIVRVSAVTALASLLPFAAYGQSTGQVSTGGSQSSTLQSLLGKDAGGGGGLNMIANTSFGVDRFDSYAININTRDRYDGSNYLLSAPTTPFRLTTKGATAGGDYLFANGFLIGALVNVKKSDYNFNADSAEQVRSRALTSNSGQIIDQKRLINKEINMGTPLNKNYSAHGGTLAFGYIQGNFTIIGTGSYESRQYNQMRRQLAVRQDMLPSLEEFHLNNADYKSSYFSGEIMASYTHSLGSATITPIATFGISRERVGSYQEKTVGYLFSDATNTPYTSQATTGIGATDSARTFASDQITSLPVSLGALARIPVGDADSAFLSAVNIGSSWTTDLAGQVRTIRTESANLGTATGAATGAATPYKPDTQHQERNRNVHMISLTAGVELNPLPKMPLALNYRHDFGFSERHSADIFTAQLRYQF